MKKLIGDATSQRIMDCGTITYGDTISLLSDIRPSGAAKMTMLNVNELTYHPWPTPTDLIHEFRAAERAEVDRSRAKATEQSIYKVKELHGDIFDEAVSKVEGELIASELFSQARVNVMDMNEKVKVLVFRRHLNDTLPVSLSQEKETLVAYMSQENVENRWIKMNHDFEVHAVSLQNGSTSMMNDVKLHFLYSKPFSEFMGTFEKPHIYHALAAQSPCEMSEHQKREKFEFDKDMLSRPKRISVDRSEWDPISSMIAMATMADYQNMLSNLKDRGPLEVVVRHSQDQRIYDDIVNKQEADLNAILEEERDERALHEGTQYGVSIVDMEPFGLKSLKAAVANSNSRMRFQPSIFK
ncbi:hypothetical protein BJ878DRAFT_565333 [Calycina marina]|uniref:Uncharacterized protein n=1 Tax=Calycina marina TaxID=1763456 RepID=A0A9P7Z7T3_9HELO|nr:hypothetical protein BJ878DRAFT_565333 [Calycina marina]